MSLSNPIEAGYLASLFGETLYLVGESTAAEAPVADAKPVEINATPAPVIAEAAAPVVVETPAPAVKPATPEITLPKAPVEKISIPKVEKAPEPVAAKAPEPVASSPAPFAYLGQNKKEVLILTEDKNQEYISASDAALLEKILTAVGLTMNDVALVNIASYPNLDWMKLRTEVKYRYMIAFTPSAALLHKNLQIPLYTTKRTNTLDFLISDTLASLEKSIDQKKKLWGNLKGFLPA